MKYSTEEVVTKLDLPLKKYASGKVREIYDLSDRLLMVTTDRISAFDYVLPSAIPYKGKVLTGLSAYWFGLMGGIVDNHLVTADIAKFPEELQKYREILSGRSMIVLKAKRIDVECVVRGYISGSAWKEYKQSGTVCGVKMPSGMEESERFSEPVFTPSTKSDTGHDENISIEKMKDLVGKDLTCELEETSIKVYEKAARKAKSGRIIIADTKFEYGQVDGKTMLIDELLTPDSSRFWDLRDYSPGRSQTSFDKQFVRDYLEGIKWNKAPPAPVLPDDIAEKTADRYLEAYNRITGSSFPGL